jgi:hypothetical protein
MRPTRLRWLLVWLLAGLVVGGVVVAGAYGDLPPLPRYAPITLVLLAVVEVLMARVVRDRVQGLARRGARAVHPVQVARAAALAKASSPCGALLLGGYAGLAVRLLPSEASAPRSDLLVCGVSALASLGLVGAALLLERACRTPDEPADLPGLGSRS